MPELRKDPIISRWVIIATERARRSSAFVDSINTQTEASTCPFCKATTAVDVLAHHAVKVFKSGTPFFREAEEMSIKQHGLYQVCHSHGSHEVVIETPAHVSNMADLDTPQIQHVFEAYAMRMSTLQEDSGVKSVLAYKNYGVSAGSRDIGHARSQIMAFPVVPMRMQDKINGAKLYFDFHDRSLFLDIVRQERKEEKRVVKETDHFIAFCPFAARFPFETWILPKPSIQHYNYAQGVKGHEKELSLLMKELLLKYKIGLNDPAYNYVIQSASKALDVEEAFSWHIELLPRLTRVAGFERGTGFYINPIPPEMTAKFLREVTVHV